MEFVCILSENKLLPLPFFIDKKKTGAGRNGINFEQARDGSGIHSSNFTRSGTGQEFYFTSILGLGWDRKIHSRVSLYRPYVVFQTCVFEIPVGLVI